MGEIWLTGVLSSYRGIAIPLSLLVEIIIAVAGFLPSFFITAANVAVFGLFWGTALSILGESLGAVVAFTLYRSGLDRLAGGSSGFATGLESRMTRLSEAPEGRAFFLVLGFRLIPYVPSGMVTLGAAGGRMSLWTFTAASTLGKIPALAVEVATVSLAMQLPLKGFLTIAGAGIILWAAFILWRNRKRR